MSGLPRTRGRLALLQTPSATNVRRRAQRGSGGNLPLKRREILALFLIGTALGIFLMSISFAIAEFLPGAVEQRDWLFAMLGLGPTPPIYSNPLIGLLATLTCLTPFNFLLAVIAALLWRSAQQQRKNEQDRRRQLSDWSTTALLYVIEGLFRTSTEGAAAWRSQLEEARRGTYPHLVGPQRRWFERAAMRLGGVAEGHASDLSAPRPRRWPRLVTNVLAVGAIGQAGMAGAYRAHAGGSR